MIFTSDNGGVLDDGYQDGSATDTSGHQPNGSLRGYKGSLFEGGHRVPFIARWPAQVPAGTADQLVCHVDLLATCAAIIGSSAGCGRGAGQLRCPACAAVRQNRVRDHLVHHSGGFPGVLGMRRGSWKLLQAAQGYAGKPDRQPLLFNLADDPAEDAIWPPSALRRCASSPGYLTELREQGREATSTRRAVNCVGLTSSRVPIRSPSDPSRTAHRSLLAVACRAKRC